MAAYIQTWLMLHNRADVNTYYRKCQHEVCGGIHKIKF